MGGVVVVVVVVVVAVAKPWTCYDWRVCANNTLADEINRKDQDQNNYLTMLDYNFCRTVVSEWTNRRPREEDGRSRGLGECTSLAAPS